MTDSNCLAMGRAAMTMTMTMTMSVTLAAVIS